MAQDKLHGRLLVWKQDGDTYLAQTPGMSAIVFRQGRGYHWEILHQGEVKYHGHRRSLHSALSHVEGNCVGRGMLEDVPRQEAEAAEE